MTILLPSSYATGNQLPTSSVVPDFATNDVLDTIDLLSEAGLELLDWQAVLLEAWMGVLSNGRWSAPVAGNEAPRQNGKTRDIQARAAAEMLFYDGTVIYTSQLQKTSTETFEEMASLMDTKKLRKFLAPNGIRTALGREEIRLKSGAKMKFLARTRNGGNGQHGSLLIFDEAQYLDQQAQGSFLAAISACRTRRGPQTIYNGNAPEEGDNSAVFERIRSDALSGKTKRTAWTEWSIGSSREVPDVSDRSMWERTNPSVGVLISFDTIEAEFESEDPVQFAHQRLGWFRDRGGEKGLFGQEEWDALEVEDAPESWDKLCYGVKFTADGEFVSLSVCVTNGGFAHVELIREEEKVEGLDWLEEFFSRPGLFKEAACVAIDGKADVKDLKTRLVKRRIPEAAIHVITTADAISSAGMMVNAVREGKVSHLADPELSASVLGATKRKIGKEGFGFGGEYPERIDSCALALFAARTTKRDPKKKGRVGC